MIGQGGGRVKEIDELFEIIYGLYERLDGNNKLTDTIKTNAEAEAERQRLIESFNDVVGYIDKIAAENKKLTNSCKALKTHNAKYRIQISELKEKCVAEIQATKERFARGGRPPIPYATKEAALNLNRRGMSLRKIAELCNISKSSVENIIKEFEKEAVKKTPKIKKGL